jgi:hypothetical protein
VGRKRQPKLRNIVWSPDEHNWIQECAEHLRTRCHPPYDLEFSKQAEQRVDAIFKGLDLALKNIRALRDRCEADDGWPWASVGMNISEAEHDIASWRRRCMYSKQAILEQRDWITSEHGPAGLRRETISSVRLAWAFCEKSKPRSARAMAKQIMLEAGIDIPSEPTLGSLLKQVK